MAISAIYDMPLIRQIAFSTIPETRRNLLRALLLSGDSLTSTDAVTALRVTKPTALVWMKELAATGMVEITLREHDTSQPTFITLAEDWKWLSNGYIAQSPGA